MAAAAPTHPDARPERGPLLRLALFGALVLAVSAAAAGIGAAVGDSVEVSSSAGGHGEEMGGEEASGLGVSAHGEYLAVFESTRFVPGEPERLSFRVLDSEGAPVTDLDEHGGVQMHVIVVRRDFEGYQHLHPTLAPDGSWQTELTLPAGGVYRAFADFERDGEKVVLGTDLLAAGAFDPSPLPPPQSVATVNGYDVGMLAEARAGEETELAFAIARNGVPAELEDYLGAKGHLVALREGDLAYLHVHPLEDEDAVPGEVRFAATFPTPGSYRLFLQFQEDGQVQTVPFTLEVER